MKNQSLIFIARIFKKYSYNVQNYWEWKAIDFLLISGLALIVIRSMNMLLKTLLDKEIDEKLMAFINIWPISQWIYSLVTLILMYWLIGSWYNKKLAREGGWISWQARVNMIVLDLTINLCLGIYYMDARETLIGSIMLNCPIAISPIIFLIEFVAFIWYYRRYVLIQKKKKDGE